MIGKKYNLPLTWPTVAILVVGAVGLVILYVWNPTELSIIPRCPFLELTGLKCPGCGTLRGLHALLHLRLIDAWNFNPLMIISLPVMGLLLFSRTLSRNRVFSSSILIVTILWWIARNLFLSSN